MSHLNLANRFGNICITASFSGLTTVNSLANQHWMWDYKVGRLSG